MACISLDGSCHKDARIVGHGYFFRVQSGQHGRYIVDDALLLCDKIMHGEDDQIRSVGFDGKTEVYIALKRGSDFMPACGSESNIVYRKDKIFGRKGKAILAGKPYIDV